MGHQDVVGFVGGDSTIVPDDEVVMKKPAARRVSTKRPADSTGGRCRDKARKWNTMLQEGTLPQEAKALYDQAVAKKSAGVHPPKYPNIIFGEVFGSPQKCKLPFRIVGG